MKDEQEKKPPRWCFGLVEAGSIGWVCFILHPSSFILILLVPFQGDGHQERVALRAG
jgi:hypothetical protein